VSKFVLSRVDASASLSPAHITEAVDRDLLVALRELITEASASFDDFDYARALERAESFFWSFCDDYVELVKIRAYGDSSNPAAASAQATLALTLSVLQRLFAPILPFVTDEVWSWWHEGSIHRAAWPTVSELGEAPQASGAYRLASEIVSDIRREKTTAKVSQRATVSELTISDAADVIELAKLVESDIADAGSVTATVYVVGDTRRDVTLEAPTA